MCMERSIRACLGLERRDSPVAAALSPALQETDVLSSWRWSFRRATSAQPKSGLSLTLDDIWVWLNLCRFRFTIFSTSIASKFPSVDELSSVCWSNGKQIIKIREKSVIVIIIIIIYRRQWTIANIKASWFPNIADLPETSFFTIIYWYILIYITVGDPEGFFSSFISVYVNRSACFCTITDAQMFFYWL